MDVTAARLAELRRRGLSYVPGDGMGVGSAGEASVAGNVISNRHRSFSRRGLLKQKAIMEAARRVIQRFDPCGHPSLPINTLSGGNIQKAILGAS